MFKIINQEPLKKPLKTELYLSIYNNCSKINQTPLLKFSLFLFSVQPRVLIGILSQLLFISESIILLKGNALKVPESVKTPINSNGC